MRILLLVHFHENPALLRDPSPLTGLYAIITDDESVMRFQGVTKWSKPCTFEMRMEMEKFFFSEYNGSKWRTYRYLDRRFRPYQELVDEPHDKLVVCEV